MINQFLTPLVFAVFATGFGVIWYRYRQFVSAGLFALSYSLGAMAFVLEAVFEEHLGYVVIPYINDILYSLTTIVFLVALYVRFNLKPPVIAFFLITVVIVAGLTWYRFADYQVETRIRIISYGNGAIMLMALPAIWRNAQSLIDRVLVWLLGFFALQFFISTSLILQQDGEMLTVDNFSGSYFLAIMNLIVAALSLSIAITLFVKYGMDAIRALRSQTYTDDLTRLRNRRGFQEKAEYLICEADGKKSALSLVVCDLDHFKQINDRFGHATGDRVLMAFARFIADGIRQSDLVGRIGGEEFCILLPGAALATATRITEGLRDKLEQRDFSEEGMEGSLTVSCGVAEFRSGDDYESLFKRADAALYQAKRNGRNRVEAA